MPTPEWHGVLLKAILVMVERYLLDNLAILEKKLGSSARTLLDIPCNGVMVETARNGMYTLSKQAPGTVDWIQYHSKYNPEKEAREQLLKLKLDKAGFCVVFGFGLGYATEEVFKIPNIKILVVEPDLAVFRSALAVRDLSVLLSSRRVNFFLGTELDNLGEFCRSSFDITEIKDMVTLEHPPSIRFYHPFFESVKEGIGSHIIKTAENLITLMEEGIGYQENTLLSIKEIAKSPGVNTLFNKFTGFPVVIVSAGPSLDKNLFLLKNAQKNIIIICVDTALKPLLASGIKPHIVVTADPSFENYTHLCGCAGGDFFVVVEPMVYPEAVKDFSDMLFISSFDDKMMLYLQKYIGNKGTLKVWGSVSTMAFDLARKIGASPIVFIGQDLAYSSGKRYCQDTEHDGAVLSSGVNATKTVIEKTDIFGMPVNVEQQHYTYANFLYEEFLNTESRIINATEGGILRKGVELMSLREVLVTFCRSELDIYGMLRDIHQSATKKSVSLGAMEASLKRILRALKRTEKKCGNGISTASLIRKNINRNRKISDMEIKRGIVTIQSAKDDISREKDVLPFLEMSAQRAFFVFQQAIKTLDGRRVDKAFLLDAANIYSGLFKNINAVLVRIIPFFQKAYDEIHNQRSCGAL